MKNKVILSTAILLLISLMSYFMVIENGSVRAVEFLSIFGAGALAGVLLTQVIQQLRGKSKKA